MIKKCGCTHPWQDKRYGKGKRVMNKTTKDGVYRCTVCSKESGGGDFKRKK